MEIIIEFFSLFKFHLSGRLQVTFYSQLTVLIRFKVFIPHLKIKFEFFFKKIIFISYKTKNIQKSTAMQPIKTIPDGQRTKTIYNLIKDEKYQEVDHFFFNNFLLLLFFHKAIQVLNYELQFCPKSRALSLLAYCYYQSQDFSNASRM